MVLCNNEIAIPALQQLYMNTVLVAVIVPEKNAALHSLLKQMLVGTGVTLLPVNKKNLETSIRSVVTTSNITSAWLMTFSYILPKSLLALLPGGFNNFHYGLLPKYRGPNPILSQMLNGETHSGITIHVADENIDTGPVVMQQMIAIEDTDTFGMQLQKLGMLGASMAMNLLQVYSISTMPPAVPQDETAAQYFKNPVAPDLMVNWNVMNSTQVIRLINACNPWNKGAGTIVNGQVICLTHAEIIADVQEQNILPGTIISINETDGLRIVCSDNKVIRINIIYVPAGFYPGYKLTAYGIKINDKFITG